MKSANNWQKRKQEEIDRARSDLEAIKDQIDEEIYKKVQRWIDAGKPEYLQLAKEKIEFLTDFHRFAWGQVCLPEDGSGEGLDEIV